MKEEVVVKAVKDAGLQLVEVTIRENGYLSQPERNNYAALFCGALSGP